MVIAGGFADARWPHGFSAASLAVSCYHKRPRGFQPCHYSTLMAFWHIGVTLPGFVRLMNALKPKPAFQVLIMSEESRLGREAIQTGYALKQIIDAGVQVWFYLEDGDRKLESALDKVMFSLVNFASETERERAATHVRCDVEKSTGRARHRV